MATHRRSEQMALGSETGSVPFWLVMTQQAAAVLIVVSLLVAVMTMRMGWIPAIPLLLMLVMAAFVMVVTARAHRRGRRIVPEVAPADAVLWRLLLRLGGWLGGLVLVALLAQQMWPWTLSETLVVVGMTAAFVLEACTSVLDWWTARRQFGAPGTDAA